MGYELYSFYLGGVVGFVIGVLFGRKNPNKATVLAKAAALAGAKAQDLAKQAVDKMKGS